MAKAAPETENIKLRRITISDELKRAIGESYKRGRESRITDIVQLRPKKVAGKKK